MASRPRLRDPHGFTIIEVLVAATLLIVGVLGTLVVVDGANARVSETKAREGATNLVRELLERGRVIPFNKLDPATLVAQLQAAPGLGSTGGGAAWTVVRRDVPYTVTATSCALDDPKDEYGNHAAGGFCADSTAQAADDPNPQDFKRVTVEATWVRDGQSRSVRQSSVVSTRGTADAPAVKALKLESPATPEPTQPVITTAGTTTARFRLSTSVGTDRVVWSIDGVDQGDATAQSTARVEWTFDLALGSLRDGTYQIGARAVDSLGNPGPTRIIPLVLNRFAPAAPSGVVGGPNTVVVGGTATKVTELEWLPNSERNVIGYRVYDPANAIVCPSNPAVVDDRSVTCIDSTPTFGAHRVVALYRDAAGAVREGPAATLNMAAPTQTLKRYYLTPASTTKNQSNCSNLGNASASRRDMASAPGTNVSLLSATTSVWSWCDPTPMSGGERVVGTGTLYGYFVNTTGRDCPVVLKLWRNQTWVVSNIYPNIPSTSSTPTLVKLPMPIIDQTFRSGDQLGFSFAPSSCTTGINAGGAQSSYVDVPFGSPDPTPGAPTGLAVSRPGDGTVRLSWSAPTSGTAVGFYRIYRNGLEVAQRIGRTGGPTELSFVDTSPGGSPQTYRVTATSADLAESPMAGPVSG